jgi:nicotinamidase-related amidase
MSIDLAAKSAPFLAYLDDWMEQLKTVQFKAFFPHPDRTAVLSVDIINGFCTIGPLASPRVKSIIPPAVRLLTLAWNGGVRDILFSQDTHEPEAVEFSAWPAHCVRGTTEAETVSELKALPFFDQVQVIEKNSIQSGLNTGLNSWLEKRPHLDTFIVIGDCTDLCTYQLAMQLRLDANARQLERRVVVPAVAVDTYDMALEAAQTVGAMPHPADLLHATFLYHMALNGIEVVRDIIE